MVWPMICSACMNTGRGEAGRPGSRPGSQPGSRPGSQPSASLGATKLWITNNELDRSMLIN